MFFKVRPTKAPLRAARSKALLIRSDWNDYSFLTSFDLAVYDANGHRHDVGTVKIGQFGLKPQSRSRDVSGRPAIPTEFDALDGEFFSLGQGEDYYHALNGLAHDLRDHILSGLRDIALDQALFERARHEPVMADSLLRFVKEDTVRGRLHQLAIGNAELTPFRFRYSFSWPKSTEVCLSFDVHPESQPPTNIHVIIGRNGVGKTHCLRGMTLSLVEGKNESGQFVSDVTRYNYFANLISVAFSAFDPFGPLFSSQEEPHHIPYQYIGLKVPSEADDEAASKPNAAKTVEDFTEEFVRSVAKCRSGVKAARWRRALNTLEADPLFREANIGELSEDDDKSAADVQAKKTYEKLSSGHKIVLLTVTRLVETADERTLVLLDEPEAHLHPPLLSAFMRCLSDLLVQRNAVAIVATHSPVVLQEVPKSCAWILRRTGMEVRAERPRIETFGENVGILTSEVFGLEVTESGFHRLIEAAVQKSDSYEDVLAAFSSQLGAEGRAIARALLAEKKDA